jgi:cell division GTPase FtsZ
MKRRTFLQGISLLPLGLSVSGQCSPGASITKQKHSKKIKIIGVGDVGMDAALDIYKRTNSFDIDVDIQYCTENFYRLKKIKEKKEKNHLDIIESSVHFFGRVGWHHNYFKDSNYRITHSIEGFDKLYIISQLGSGRFEHQVIRMIMDVSLNTDIDVFSVISSPFQFEGKRRSKNFCDIIIEMVKLKQNMMVVCADDVLKKGGDGDTMLNAYRSLSIELSNAVIRNFNQQSI